MSLDTFKSPEFGPLGIVDNDEVIYYRDIVSRQFIETNRMEEKVGLIKSVPGMESDIIDFYIDSNYKGIVIEALGRETFLRHGSRNKEGHWQKYTCSNGVQVSNR